MDLKIKYRTGRATRKKITTGTSVRDKYEDVYEVNVVTESGTMSQSEWENAIEKRIVELKEEHIVESLIEYALEECAWIHTREGARNYALDLYASRIWENENWVGYDMFRKKLGIEVETKVEEEVIDMEFTNIESVEVKNKTIRVGARCTIKNDENVYVTGEVLELRQYKNKVTALTWDGEINVEGLYKIDKDVIIKEPTVKAVAMELKEENNIEPVQEEKQDMVTIVTMDDLIKKDMLKVSSVIYNCGYVMKNENAKILVRVENNIAIAYDDNNKTDIVRFEVSKKKKYSVVSEIEILYSVETSVEKVAEEVIDHVKGFGKITKVKVDIDDIAFIVEGHNEDKYIELIDAMFMTFNTHVKKKDVIRQIMNNHVNINEKYEQSEVEYGDFVNFIKKQNGVGTYMGVVERVNTLARTVDVKYKTTSGELDFYTIPFENLVRIKTVTLKEETIDKKEVTKLVEDIMDISKICLTDESNHDCIKVVLENAQMHKYSKGCSICATLENEKYIEKITKKDIDDDNVKSIGECSKIFIEINRDKRSNTLTVGAYVEVDFVHSDGTKDKTRVIIKEIVEKMPKNTKQNDENVVKLNKENT